MTTACAYKEGVGMTSGRDLEELRELIINMVTGLQNTFKVGETNEVSVNLWSGKAPWLQGIEKNLRDLLLLQPNWDSYGATAIDEKIVLKAFNLLFSIESKDIPKPVVVPVSDGGIDIEWNIAKIFLSLKIREDGSRFFFADRESGKRDGGPIMDGGKMIHYFALLKND